MQIDPGRMGGVCLPGSPTIHTRWRIAVYMVVFLGMLGAVVIGTDVHTVAVTILAAGYVAVEIAGHLTPAPRPMPAAG